MSKLGWGRNPPIVPAAVIREVVLAWYKFKLDLVIFVYKQLSGVVCAICAAGRPETDGLWVHAICEAEVELTYRALEVLMLLY